MKTQTVSPLARACALALGLFALSAGHSADTPSRFSVGKAQIQALGIDVALLGAAGGAVQGRYPATVVSPLGAEQVVSSPLSGLVAQVLVQQYQSVKAGAALVRIVSTELGPLQLQLMQAASRARLARQSAQREQQLFDEGIVAQRRVQEAQSSLAEAEATLAQARVALRLSGVPNSTIDRVLTTGQPVDHIMLAAPKAGVISMIETRPGQRVDPATALLSISQVDALALDIQIPATEATRWPMGTPVTIQGMSLRARVAGVSPSVVPGSQALTLRATIEGKPGGLRAGETLTVDLQGAKAAGRFDVPLSAVAYDGQQAHVFVRTPDGFEARPVAVLATAGQRITVSGPLQPQDSIAVTGVVGLKGAWLNPKEAE